MANRPKGYGLTREIASKIDAKYSDDDEMELVAWIQSIVNESPNGQGREAFQEWLKDGLVLCKLMNTFSPGSCRPTPIPETKLEAMKRNKQMENIANFLTAAENYGVAKENLFQTVDLFEGGNLSQVQITLYKLSSAAIKRGYDGPKIGVKESDKNVRELDEQKLREGRNVIGLQMGTNQVASQKGMTPYGLGRQLTPQTKY